MGSIRKSLEQFSTKSYLEATSVTIPEAKTQPCDVEDCDVEFDDEFADLAWRFEQALASERMVRMLHLFSWPHRWVGILVGDELAGIEMTVGVLSGPTVRTGGTRGWITSGLECLAAHTGLPAPFGKAA